MPHFGAALVWQHGSKSEKGEISDFLIFFGMAAAGQGHVGAQDGDAAGSVLTRSSSWPKVKEPTERSQNLNHYMNSVQQLSQVVAFASGGLPVQPVRRAVQQGQ